MTLNDKIRYTSRDLILTYVSFIRDKIREGDSRYIKLGLDEDFDVYEDLFIEAVKKAIGSKRVKARRFPKRVLDDCIGVLDLKIAELSLDDFCHKNSDVILDTCELVFNKVVEVAKENVEYKM